MNKTIIININGTVFHIEEDAYEILKQYMTEVKRHFMNSADSLEITTDIENRIAEMFNEVLLRDGKQALVEQDVRYIIEQMGSVADFEIAENEDAEPTYTQTTTGRKLFRDVDYRLLGGVCSGIGNYFDMRPLWIRLAFIIAAVFFGTGIFLYIILWIVVPKAVTRADRMAMKGEKLNLQGFKRNFEVEMGSIKSNVQSYGHEAKPFIYRSRDFISDIFGHFGRFLIVAGKWLIKIIGVLLLITAFGLLIALVALVIAFWAYGKTDIYYIFPFNIVNYHVNTIYLICGFLLLAIPLLTVLLLGVGVYLKNIVFNRSIGVTFLAIWIGALCIVVYNTALASLDLRYHASFSKTVNLKPSSTGTYYLKLDDVKHFSGDDSVRLQVKDRFKGMVIIDDSYNNVDLDGPGRRVQIDIEKSDVAVPTLVERFSANGREYEEALLNARNISYYFEQQDTVIKFTKNLVRKPGTLWRNESIHLTLKVPINTKFIIDEDMNWFINGIDVWGCKDVNKLKNSSSAPFIMTAEGIQCKVDTIVTIPTVKDSVITDATITTKK